MIGRSFATRWYRSRAVSVSSRKSSWMKGFIVGPRSGGLLRRDRLELRSQQVVDGEGDQVGEGADAEQDGVAAGDVSRGLEAVEQSAGEDGEEEAAGRAGHAAEAGDRGHVLLRE